MPRLKITIAYNGSAYCGWQSQNIKNSVEPQSSTVEEQSTIQSKLEQIISRIINQKVRVHGSGRTDAGVHAEGQVAHFDIPENRVHLDWQYSINSLLPNDISIVKVESVADSFHARFDAKAKSYVYRLWLNRHFTPPTLEPFVWTTGPLNFKAMQEAATYLLGEHDFAAFQNHGAQQENTTRNINLIKASPAEPSLEPLDDIDSFLNIQSHSGYAQTWHFKGNGFLKQMVRNIMGLLWYVGTDKIKPCKVLEIIESKDRRQAPLTAPAKALSLMKVYY